MENTATFNDYFKLHIVILVWGFTGILGKVISIPSVSIVWYRTLIAVVSLVAYMYYKGSGFSISRKTLFKYLLIGVVVAVHWILFFEALKVSTVSVTLTTLASTTLFTSLLEPLFFKKKIVIYEIFFGLIIIAGLMLIFSFETKYHLGIIYSLFSALGASIFTTVNGIFVAEGGSPIKITMYEMLGAVVIISLFFITTGNLTIENLSLLNSGVETFWLDLTYLLILGVICTAIAFVISVEVMKKLSPYTVSISINMEPIYAIILALIFFGDSEKMSPGFYVGAGMIMLTIFGNGMMKKFFSKSK
jgi:drug/metabolite transporter (DMT)-like permease